MNILITKGTQHYGYVIWNSSYNAEIEKMLKGKEKVEVHFNGFNLGEKNIDRKYHRISLGYKLTRALPEEHNTYSVKMDNDILEVISYDENKQKQL